MRLEINPKRLTINAINNDHVTYIILKLEERLFDVYVEYIHDEKIADNVKSLFVIKYLKEMLKAEKFSNNGIVCLGDDMPLSLIYSLPHDEGELTFILAPRIEED